MLIMTIMLPLRQTALVAKQAAALDIMTGGRMRLGVGVGGSKEEYEAMGVDFHTRGRRCSEQMKLLKRLWANETVTFDGEFDQISVVGINPLPIQRPIPMWIGSGSMPPEPIIRRIAQHAHGWFVMSSPEEYPEVVRRIVSACEKIGREPNKIGTEAGVAVVNASGPWFNKLNETVGLELSTTALPTPSVAARRWASSSTAR